MIKEGLDFDALVTATECCRDIMPLDAIAKIVAKPNNIMFTSGRDVGLCIYDYPGVYTVHWYYPDSRGRKAIDLGRAMTNILFEKHGAKTIRGMTAKSFKASRWAARQIGMMSLGFVQFPDDEEHEVFCKTEAMYKSEKD